MRIFRDLAGAVRSLFVPEDDPIEEVLREIVNQHIDTMVNGSNRMLRNESDQVLVECAALAKNLSLHESAEWRTPPDFFEFCNRNFGPYTLDVAATKENALCERFFTVEDNGLEQDWGTENVWCNPPYSRIAPWVRAMAAHRGRGTMLLPASTGTKWFHDLHFIATIGLLRGRIRFLRPDGTPGGSPRYDNIIAIYPGRPAIYVFDWTATFKTAPFAASESRPRSTA